MACDWVTMPGGVTAIVCWSRRHRHCKCGRVATLLCDWKKPKKRSGTCDEPLCTGCSTSPAPEKDLCPAHAAELEAWKVAQTSRLFRDEPQTMLGDPS